MIRIFDDTDKERGRIQACIDKYGWTSDHNLDWFSVSLNDWTGKPVFVEFEDGSGLLAHKYPTEWSIWSDPLCERGESADKIIEFSEGVLNERIKRIWCMDVSDDIRPQIIAKEILKIGEVDYSLFWPVLKMTEYDSSLSGSHFKEMRNAKNKFYKEHRVTTVSPTAIEKELLRKIINDWKDIILKKQKEEDICYLKYQKVVEEGFKGFLTARVFVVDGRPVGFNAGYEVPNNRGRFAGIIGIHDYSLNDQGTMLWLEDLDWVKSAGYKEMDMQGSEDDGGLKLKLRFGAKIDRKTNTFWLTK